jgi:hypothetical protein
VRVAAAQEQQAPERLVLLLLRRLRQVRRLLDQHHVLARLAAVARGHAAAVRGAAGRVRGTGPAWGAAAAAGARCWRHGARATAASSAHARQPVAHARCRAACGRKRLLQRAAEPAAQRARPRPRTGAVWLRARQPVARLLVLLRLRLQPAPLLLPRRERAPDGTRPQAAAAAATAAAAAERARAAAAGTRASRACEVAGGCRSWPGAAVVVVRVVERDHGALDGLRCGGRQLLVCCEPARVHHARVRRVRPLLRQQPRVQRGAQAQVHELRLPQLHLAAGGHVGVLLQLGVLPGAQPQRLLRPAKQVRQQRVVAAEGVALAVAVHAAAAVAAAAVVEGGAAAVSRVAL